MQMPVLMASHDQEGHVSLHFNHPDLRNAIVPLMMPLLSSDADTNANGMIWHQYWGQWYHVMKRHVVPYFNHFDVWNWVLLFMMPSALCVADANTKGVIWPKKSCCASFQWSWPKECSGTIDDSISITWHPMATHDQKSHVTTHFICPVLRNSLAQFTTLSTSCDVDADDIGITWPKKSYCTSCQ